MSGAIPAWAVTGAKVVCRRDDFERGETIGLMEWLWICASGSKPVAGGLYVITDVALSANDAGEEMAYVRLRYFGKRLHPLWMFEPVVETKPDNEVEARLFRARGRKLRDATETREPVKEDG